MADSSTSSAPSTSSFSAALSGKSESELEEMLDQMLTRLAFCDDSKLQDLLSKLLPLSIASLSSPSKLICNKVIEILSHVNKRVKHQTGIGLPLNDLWQLYVECGASSMVRNFCIVYIEMALERARQEEKENMAPLLLASISSIPPQHQEILLRNAVKVMGECHATKINEEVAAKYQKLGGSQDSEIFLEFCLHTILYQPTQSDRCPPGLSVKQRDRVTGKKLLTNDALRSRKLGILNILEAMKLPAELVYSLYISACTDSQESVARRGEELLKKDASGVNLDDTHLMHRLFSLFNGSVGAEHVSPESRVSPANPALRLRLISTFCRSITAANSFPYTLQCIFGCIYGSDTTLRLKQFGMEFTVWVFKHAKMDQLKLMGPVILSGILKSLDSYSTSTSGSVSKDIKIFSFQAIGLLAQRMPQLFRDKLDVAVLLFDALKLEDHFVRLTIQEATNSLAVAYKDAPSMVLKNLESLLLRNYQVEQGEVRFCSVRWATSLFDTQHCPSRFICMLGAGDSKLDIREMALEGLFPGENQQKTVGDSFNVKYPKLGDMIEYITEQQPGLLDSTVAGDTGLPFVSKSYVAMVKFVMKCFQADVEENNSIGSSTFTCSLDKLCLLLEHAMSVDGSVELHVSASKALITIGSHYPQMIELRYANKVSWLNRLLGHLDLDTRESIARLLGFASCALSVDDSCGLIQDLISSIGKTPKLRYEMQHGVLCSLGYVTANCLLKQRNIPESLLQSALKCLVDVVTSETATLASVAMQALGHIGLSTSMPQLFHDSEAVLILTILRERLTKLLFSDDHRAIQRIAISLGHMCVNEPSLSNLNIALDLIFSLCRTKVEDVLFATGEALSFLWGWVPVSADMILRTNYTSLSMSSNFLMRDVSSALSRTSSTDGISSDDSHSAIRDQITTKLFDVLLYSNKKEERCAGTVWLLSLTIYCGHHPTIHKLLPDIQDAFSHLLAEQNDLTQELASQGLSIVYELGDASMKKNLVNALVGTLTGSGKRKRAVKLMEDSEVFQEGAIGESPIGGKLSTYKELCNLANEMGQPDLIYKFMDLANYQASLNSKRGAAFGFSKIAKLAGDALQPHLRLLIPRLFRYQYDPDINVQDAMTHIWRSLVADSKGTIDEHLDLIIDDLLVQCVSRLWRSREASCLALADIIQGRRFDEVGKHLKGIWIAAFRAVDDIKETVRKSGERLCRAVTSLTVRLCDVSLTPVSEARQTMDIVLPLLLTEGIMSKVDDIRKASIGVTTKIAKGSGIAIRPHLTNLVCCMLESLSSLEDQGLNYVELHAANVGLQSEKLESLRISIAKSSPMWETLGFCIEVVDAQSLESLVPRLAQLVRSGVGLNTRVGVASFLSLLVQKVGASIKPFAGMLLKLLLQAVKDEKSSASKRALANACATVLKYAAPSQAQKLIEDTAALHTGDRNAQISCATLLKSFSSVATDILSGYYAVIVPVIFFSRFEDDKAVSNLYEEIWEESMSGERTTLQLYLGETTTLISEGLASSSWASKRKAAQAISKLCEVLGELVSSHIPVLLTSVMSEIPGRLWEGKDALLDALSAICSSCHESISELDPDLPNSILNLVSFACSKKVPKFREAAFCCLEQVIKTFGILDFFNKVFPLLSEMCYSLGEAKSRQTSLASEVKTGDEDNLSAVHDKIINCITSAIHVAHIKDIIQHQDNLVKVFLISLSPNFPWPVKISVFASIKELCSRLDIMADDAQDPSIQTSIPQLVQKLFYSTSTKVLDCIRSIKIAQVHISASECLLVMINMLRAVSDDLVEGEFKAELHQLYEVEKNEQAKSSLKKCIDMLDSLEQSNQSLN